MVDSSAILVEDLRDMPLRGLMQLHTGEAFRVYMLIDGKRTIFRTRKSLYTVFILNIIVVRVVIDKRVLEDILEGRVGLLRGKKVKYGKYKVVRFLTPKK
jgi:hypothetical protein